MFNTLKCLIRYNLCISRVSVKYRWSSGEVSAESRRDIGEVSAEYQQGICKLMTMSANKHLNRYIGCHSTDYWPRLDLMLTDVSANYRPTISRLSVVITYPLIFAPFYWLLYVTWCKFTGRLSRNNPRLCQHLPSYYFH